MSGEAKRRGWNDEQRKTLARGGEALKNVGKLAGAWLFGTTRQADEATREIADGLEEKVGELQQQQRRANAITVGGEAVDEDPDVDTQGDGSWNRIECLDCQTMVGAVGATATFDVRAIDRFAREHAGHNLNGVRPVKQP